MISVILNLDCSIKLCINFLFQVDCLQVEGVLQKKNLVYCASTRYFKDLILSTAKMLYRAFMCLHAFCMPRCISQPIFALLISSSLKFETHIFCTDEYLALVCHLWAKSYVYFIIAASIFILMQFDVILDRLKLTMIIWNENIPVHLLLIKMLKKKFRF